MRLKLAIIIAAVIALPIAAQARNHKAANGHHKLKTMQGKIKGQSTVDQPKVDMPGDSYSLTR
ncbi:MAG TPA: hypothetical protein VHU22_19805 [Xanthobacteraceae bacterium]|jgi:hypothetical protein|nr:hypothetical protein [Xanthobacteraceae bacterium]